MRRGHDALCSAPYKESIPASICTWCAVIDGARKDERACIRRSLSFYLTVYEPTQMRWLGNPWKTWKNGYVTKGLRLALLPIGLRDSEAQTPRSSDRDER